MTQYLLKDLWLCENTDQLILGCVYIFSSNHARENTDQPIPDCLNIYSSDHDSGKIQTNLYLLALMATQLTMPLRKYKSTNSRLSQYLLKQPWLCENTDQTKLDRLNIY